MKKSSKELNFLMSNHISTKRDYLERMNNSKISCMKEAKKYGKNTGMATESLVMVGINISLIDGQKLQKE